MKVNVCICVGSGFQSDSNFTVEYTKYEKKKVEFEEKGRKKKLERKEKTNSSPYHSLSYVLKLRLKNRMFNRSIKGSTFNNHDIIYMSDIHDTYKL